MSNPAKYRKKPVVIEAMEFLGNEVTRSEQEASAHSIVRWIGEHGHSAASMDSSRGRYVVIATLEGKMEATPGDFIIKGVQGEFYPCKPDIFAKTYELEIAA